MELNLTIVNSPDNETLKSKPNKKEKATKYLTEGKDGLAKISDELKKLGPDLNR